MSFRIQFAMAFTLSCAGVCTPFEPLTLALPRLQAAT
jgi:hypothetical protein